MKPIRTAIATFVVAIAAIGGPVAFALTANPSPVAAFQQSTFSITIPDVVHEGAPGARFPYTFDVPTDLIDATCTAVGMVGNNASEHDGNDVDVTSAAGAIRFIDVEHVSGGITIGAGTVTLGDTVTATIILADPPNRRYTSIWSASFTITFTCTTQPPPTEPPPTEPPPTEPPPTEPPPTEPPPTEPPVTTQPPVPTTTLAPPDSDFTVDCPGADLIVVTGADRVGIDRDGTITWYEPTEPDGSWVLSVWDGDTVYVEADGDTYQYDQSAASFAGSGDCINEESG